MQRIETLPELPRLPKIAEIERRQDVGLSQGLQPKVLTAGFVRRCLPDFRVKIIDFNTRLCYVKSFIFIGLIAYTRCVWRSGKEHPAWRLEAGMTGYRRG